ncbi:MAG: HAD-IC family P-type ATPase [Tenericutes bacterium]|nr:HAD-IC family P-type ATPase [Mycoplasmatota bacterium]
MKKINGLTNREVEEKIALGKVNKINFETSESISTIIKKNIFTYFNVIFMILAILVTFAGAFRNLTFLIVVTINVLIGIFQQIRSKMVLDKLSLLDKCKYSIIRDNKEIIVYSDELVEGDYVKLSSGNQVPADGVLVDGKIFVNESLLTGEQDEREKMVNSNLLSGSFVVSGSAIVKLTNVGDESYSSKIMKESKKIKENKTEMIKAIDRIVLVAGIVIIPIGLLLFGESYFVNKFSYSESVVRMVSALIGMIPEGLYLLTTVALALSAMRLAEKKVLLHDMKSIESLARTDVLCIDKTGTITTNEMDVIDIFDENGVSYLDKKKDKKLLVLANYVNSINDNNATINALREYLKNISKQKLNMLKYENFNSKNKYSYIKMSENVTYKLGAPDVLLNKDYNHLISKRTINGERIIVFVKEENNECVPILFISLKNEIRKNAREIIKFFNDREVEIRVISGDNPVTVSSIAKEVGIKNYDLFVDCSLLKTRDELKNAVDKYKIFGRVSPEQKREIIRLIKENGLKVAMTGDGVNDILAMKEADCSIAMGNGSDAAREAAQVVLLDSDFGNMRNIVYEGRKNINNITRSASLFTYKNIFSLLLSIYAIIFTIAYPLEPNQVSLGSAFTIGIPAFFLTFEENQKKQQNDEFWKNIFLKSLPSAIISFLAIVCMVKCSVIFDINSNDLTTACSYLFFTGGFIILYKCVKPLNKYRTIVFIGCILGMIITINMIPEFFSIRSISLKASILVTMFALFEIIVAREILLLFNKFKEFIEDKRKYRKRKL